MSDNGSYFETTYPIRIIKPMMIGSAMAGANLPAKKYSKKAPTQLRLSFEVAASASSDLKFIDIARALSAINRKFYRQGVYYYVNSVELHNDENSVVDLLVAPDTWVTKNAWNRGFRTFQNMNAQVDTPRPKYHDFKIKLLTTQTESNTMDPDLYTSSMNSGNAVPDEWEFSKFTTLLSDGGAADEFTVHLLGPHDGAAGNRNSVGLIASYGDSRPHPDSSGSPVIPTDATTDPLNLLFDASGDHALEDIQSNLADDNDETPYDHNGYIGEGAYSLVQVARLTTVLTSHRVAKSSGFCVPFGLIAVRPQQTSTGYSITLNLAAGTYHGVYAERA